MMLDNENQGDRVVFSVRGLLLALSNKPILKNLAFDVRTGRVLMLIGPSGSGKSTLLRVFNRLLEPPQGAVFLSGEDITQMPVLVLRRRVGMVFQQPAMLAGTVAENVAYGPGLLGEQLSPVKINHLLEAVSLPPAMAAEDTANLSGGEAQRVALARTLATGPEVILLDEPTASLDPGATRQVEKTLLALNREQGLTLIWVSHDIEQIRRVGGDVILLRAGEQQAVGSVDDLLDPENGRTDVLDFAAGKVDSVRSAGERTTEEGGL